jgi:hypothetical protein
VTDHGSQSGTTSVTMPTPCERQPEPVSSQSWRHVREAASRFELVICRFCGRAGRLLNPFHESG